MSIDGVGLRGRCTAEAPVPASMGPSMSIDGVEIQAIKAGKKKPKLQWGRR